MKTLFMVVAVVLTLAGSIIGAYGVSVNKQDLVLRGVYAIALAVAIKTIFADEAEK